MDAGGEGRSRGPGRGLLLWLVSEDGVAGWVLEGQSAGPPDMW